MLVVIDNYDSFTYNLVQYLGELGAEVEAVRNDVASVEDLLGRGWDRVVVSPGPCTPREAGVSVEVMRRFPEAGVPALEQLVDRGGVVADDLELRPQLPQVLDEVVGEGVVVVDDEDATHGHSRCLAASSIARTTPRALARDSSYS